MKANQSLTTGTGPISVSRAIQTSLSANTRRAYRAAWRRFVSYCDELGVDPLAAAPDDVAKFLARMASVPRSSRATTKKGEPLALGTIKILVAAINRKYRDEKRPSPADDPQVASVLRGLGQLLPKQPRQVRALREFDLRGMLRYCDDLARQRPYRTRAARDAAALAIGFAGALRRSEICGLRLADVEFMEPHGVLVHIRTSKTDQAGEGQTVAIPDGALIQPVKRIRAWLDVSGITSGPLLQTVRRGGAIRGRRMHPSDIARIVKRYAEAVGLDPSKYSGHSLRAGFVTSAAIHRARLDKIMEVTRHTSPRTVLRYIRQANAFEDHAGAAFL